MDKFLPITQPALPKQLRLPVVRKPAAMFDPAPEKVILAGDEVGIGLRAGSQHAPDLLAQLRRRPFIGIQTEHPVVRGMGQGLVPQAPESMKVMLIDLVGKFPADALGGVGTVGIHHDDFIRPSNGLQTSPHIGLVIVGDDHGRHRNVIHSSRSFSNNDEQEIVPRTIIIVSRTRARTRGDSNRARHSPPRREPSTPGRE